MSLIDDAKSVARELSPILAGFKLALILISYFGLGSIAQWVIVRWYPFTRWVWDLFCIHLNFPKFPDLIKDSLTALVFFLPLGISAVMQINKGEANNSSRRHRGFGAFFGVLFLFVICKDVLSEIAISIVNAQVSVAESYPSKVKEWAAKYYSFTSSLEKSKIILILSAYIAMTSILAIYSFKNPNSAVGRLMRKSIGIGSRTVTAFASSVSIISGVGSGIFYNSTSPLIPSPVLAAISIMFLIIGIIAAAVAFAPRKLFITTGAAIAFVLAALVFEFVIGIKSFIDSVSVT